MFYGPWISHDMLLSSWLFSGLYMVSLQIEHIFYTDNEAVGQRRNNGFLSWKDVLSVLLNG